MHFCMNAGIDSISATGDQLGTPILSLASVLGLVTIALLLTVIVSVCLGYRLFQQNKNTARYILICCRPDCVIEFCI